MQLKRQLMRQVIRLARARGYDVTPSWKVQGQDLARHLRALVAYYRIDCVLDVGANRGQYHDLLREDVGFEGWIISFEPVRRYADRLLARAAADSKWRVFDLALGSADETAEIHVTLSPGLNSFLKPRADAVPGFWRKDPLIGTESVHVRTLDGVFDPLQKECRFRSPYLKLDTQGFDLEVLKGGQQTLSRVRALQTEASVLPLYQGMPDWQEVVRYLAQRDFELSGMFPVVHDDALRLIEFDCVAINRRYVDGSQ